jgi:DNA gyrase subunit B
LRGKIINVEKARIDRVLGNNEIRTMVTALGTGIGQENFDIGKLRYHKIIIMTDADVDGAHIRTLLLTFFFRQMVDLIKGGFVYIAQPPLFRVKKGKQEQYLDNETQRDRFLLELAIDGVTVEHHRRGNGAAPVVAAKAQLKEILEDVIALGPVSAVLTRKGLPLTKLLALRNDGGRLPRYMVTLHDEVRYAYSEDEQAKLIEELDEQAEQAEEAAAAERQAPTGEQLDLLLDQADADLPAKAKHDVVELPESEIVEAMLRRLEKLGIPTDLMVHQEFEIDPNNPFEEYHPFLVMDGEKKPMTADSLPQVLERVREIGAKGVMVQRYKGLGEMNAEQLWDTTMDPAKRRLTRVELPDLVEADRIFTILMGDEVDPRRRFIQQNAPEVRNLDV